MDPESFLIEKDLLAPWFDSMANPTYHVTTSRIAGEFKDFEAALDRYLLLVKNWRATEDYVQPRIFKWSEKWVQGAPPPDPDG